MSPLLFFEPTVITESSVVSLLFSQASIALPFIVLYEVGVIVARLFGKKKVAEDDDEEEDEEETEAAEKSSEDQTD